jgi:hypothetical protein
MSFKHTLFFFKDLFYCMWNILTRLMGKRVPVAKRVFVDESGVNECLKREFGRAPRGEDAKKDF